MDQFWVNQIELLVLTGTAGLSGTGNSLANRIEGNAGDNVIAGGGGADELVGGAGADTFLYSLQTDSTAGEMDWLSDFAHGLDRIDVRPVTTLDFTFDVFEGGTPGAWTRSHHNHVRGTPGDQGRRRRLARGPPLHSLHTAEPDAGRNRRR